ncbi:MAG: adenylosuccinate lyase [Verrucomicrobiota bacterium]
MSKTSVPNVLAERYASAEMTAIWSPEGKVRLERQLWIAVMKAQRDLGIAIPSEAIEAYERVQDQVDLASIRQREEVTRHDVKARIEEFCELADEQQIHKGLTSRDLTENVEQLQTYRALVTVEENAVSSLLRFGKRAKEWRDLVITARTHNVAAQLTTLGKRMAMFGEEFFASWRAFREVRTSYTVRGLKGAVGTQLDPLHLLDGDASKVDALEDKVAEHLGLPGRCGAVGQVYPRSMDHRVVSALVDLGSGPSSFARTLRLMAGHELASEGFAPGQTGSSAMPHKMNSRSCERINGFHTLLRGYLTMAAGLAGDQWNEGDVSCSVVRRVVLPDAFFSIDGLLETTLVVLEQMEAYPAVIGRENAHYLPFLLSTTFMMEAVKAGETGREEAHQAIKEHALGSVRAIRSGETEENEFLKRLAQDDRIPLSAPQLASLLERGRSEVGTAHRQVEDFCQRVALLENEYPEAAARRPAAIL